MNALSSYLNTIFMFNDTEIIHILNYRILLISLRKPKHQTLSLYSKLKMDNYRLSLYNYWHGNYWKIRIESKKANEIAT